MIGKLVRATGLSGTDRLLGLVFGLLRGGGLAVVLVLVLGFTPLPSDPWWRQSQLLPGFERGAQWLRGWLPDAAARGVRFPQRRSEERRGGEECVSTCRYRWAQDH